MPPRDLSSITVIERATGRVLSSHEVDSMPEFDASRFIAILNESHQTEWDEAFGHVRYGGQTFSREYTVAHGTLTAEEIANLVHATGRPRRRLKRWKHYIKFPLMWEETFIYTSDKLLVGYINPTYSERQKHQLLQCLNLAFEGTPNIFPAQTGHMNYSNTIYNVYTGVEIFCAWAKESLVKKYHLSNSEEFEIMTAFSKWASRVLDGSARKPKKRPMKRPPYVTRPPWCNYPGEVERPAWGCWSLLNGNIKCERNCREANGEWCECHNADWRKKREKEKREKEIKTL